MILPWRLQVVSAGCTHQPQPACLVSICAANHNMKIDDFCIDLKKLHFRLFDGYIYCLSKLLQILDFILYKKKRIICYYCIQIKCIPISQSQLADSSTRSLCQKVQQSLIFRFNVAMKVKTQPYFLRTLQGYRFVCSCVTVGSSVCMGHC